MRVFNWLLVTLLFAPLALSAETTRHPRSEKRLQIPSERKLRVPSPTGRFVLFGETRWRDEKDKCTQCVPVNSRLWLEDRVSGKHTPLIDVNRAAYAAWSPDGNAFYVEDDFGSNGAESFIYLADSLKKLDLEELILAADSEAKRLISGHAYLQVERWKDSQNLQVRLVGHTDEKSPVCFEKHYLINLIGSVTKISSQTGSTDKSWCRF